MGFASEVNAGIPEADRSPPPGDGVTKAYCIAYFHRADRLMALIVLADCLRNSDVRLGAECCCSVVGCGDFKWRLILVRLTTYR